jgi:hypothetical protein
MAHMIYNKKKDPQTKAKFSGKVKRQLWLLWVSVVFNILFVMILIDLLLVRGVSCHS